MFRNYCLLAALLLSIAAFGKTKKSTATTDHHVIIIGIDGWGAFMVNEPSDIPNIRSVMNRGTYTLKKRTMLPSDSGRNWCEMFSGAPFSMTGLLDNDCTPKFQPVLQTEHGFWPTIFHEMRQQRPDSELGAILEWSSPLNMLDTLCLSHFERVKDCHRGGREWLDRCSAYIKAKKPNLMFIHIDQVDGAMGVDSLTYFQTLEGVDKQIGELLQAIREAGIYDQTTIVLTSDHGGDLVRKEHGESSLHEIETPFIIAGPGIKKGGQLITDTMTQMDVTTTIAHYFGLTPPQCWRGAVIDVFE